MIDLTSSSNNTEDLWGNMDSNLTIFFDNSLREFLPKLIKIFDDNYIHSFIESFPSEILFRQIFNEKIKIGNLIVSKPPNIVVLPSNHMQALKEWSVLLFKQNYAKLKMAMATEKEDICEPVSIAVPNPQYFTIGSIFMDIYPIRCKKENKMIISNEMNQIYYMLKKGEVDAGIMWEHQAKLNNFKYVKMNRTLNLEIGVFKGADKNVMKAYEIMNSDEFRKYLTEIIGD
jgi:ABC-type molybdate transport system substrate-binding protein